MLVHRYRRFYEWESNAARRYELINSPNTARVAIKCAFIIRLFLRYPNWTTINAIYTLPLSTASNYGITSLEVVI